MVEPRERVRDFIYDCTKDEFNAGWTLSAHQADDLIELCRTLPTDQDKRGYDALIVEMVASAIENAETHPPGGARAIVSRELVRRVIEAYDSTLLRGYPLAPRNTKYRIAGWVGFRSEQAQRSLRLVSLLAG